MSSDREEALKDFEEYIGAIASKGVLPEEALVVARELDKIRSVLSGEETGLICLCCGADANDADGRFKQDGEYVCFECIEEYADEYEGEKWQN